MGKMSQGKKKSYYRKSAASYRKQDRMLQSGMKGILITCSGNESKCVKEAYNLLNEYADQLYGPETCPDDKQETIDGENESDEEEEDISDLLDKEVNALKVQHQSKVKRFRSARTGTKNVIFIQTTGVDPHTLVMHILTDLDKTKTKKTRNIQRMLPVSHTCKAFEDKIEKTAQEMIFPVFLASDAIDSSFCIMFKARNNNKIKKEPIVQLLAPLVTQGSSHIHKVDFNSPDHIVMVDVMGGMCCLSILKDYNRFKKYNLHLVASSDDIVMSGERKRKMIAEDEVGEEDTKKLKVGEGMEEVVSSGESSLEDERQETTTTLINSHDVNQDDTMQSKLPDVNDEMPSVT
ncbi:THUMP domain-containing protein 1-like [Lytechinus variegatus]|uniref:THUMP domain-containing protein 1-like n=1 Tax=Lytechinus variegatus TaxID=7654 RepID=UPI001BB2B214|nr:THUMP domain-containing protein 1-like [Lytechinus variegatus]